MIQKRSSKIQNSNGRLVEGYALVFNVPSDNLDTTEIIHHEAIDEDLIANSDVYATYNHGDIIYARSNHGKGTLNLSVDDKGLKFSFEAPNTQWGDDLVTMLRNGDLNKCSFAFQCNPDDIIYTRQADGTIRRDIYKIRQLFDVSIVPIPAYSATSVSVRKAEELKKKEINENYDELLKLLQFS